MMDYTKAEVTYGSTIANNTVLEITLGTGNTFNGIYLDVNKQMEDNPEVDVVAFKNWQGSEDLKFYLHEVQLQGKKAALIGDGDFLALEDVIDYVVHGSKEVTEVF